MNLKQLKQAVNDAVTLLGTGDPEDVEVSGNFNLSLKSTLTTTVGTTIDFRKKDFELKRLKVETTTFDGIGKFVLIIIEE